MCLSSQHWPQGPTDQVWMTTWAWALLSPMEMYWLLLKGYCKRKTKYNLLVVSGEQRCVRITFSQEPCETQGEMAGSPSCRRSAVLQFVTCRRFCFPNSYLNGCNMPSRGYDSMLNYASVTPSQCAPCFLGSLRTVAWRFEEVVVVEYVSPWGYFMTYKMYF